MLRFGLHLHPLWSPYPTGSCLRRTAELTSSGSSRRMIPKAPTLAQPHSPQTPSRQVWPATRHHTRHLKLPLAHLECTPVPGLVEENPTPSRSQNGQRSEANSAFPVRARSLDSRRLCCPSPGFCQHRLSKHHCTSHCHYALVEAMSKRCLLQWCTCHHHSPHQTGTLILGSHKHLFPSPSSHKAFSLNQTLKFGVRTRMEPPQVASGFAARAALPKPSRNQ